MIHFLCLYSFSNICQIGLLSNIINRSVNTKIVIPCIQGLSVTSRNGGHFTMLWNTPTLIDTPTFMNTPTLLVSN